MKSLLIAMGLMLLAPSAGAADGCAYAGLGGEELTFRPTYPGGEEYGYQGWYLKPDVGKTLPYEPYVGRKGKVLPDLVTDATKILKFKKVVLENCDVVYAQLTSGQLPHNVFSALDEEIANLLIGKKIWVDQTSVGTALDLVTLDSNVSYQINNVEPLTVTELYLPGIGHARGLAPFYLKVQKATGEEGYLPFNTIYFHTTNPIPDGTPLPIVKAIEQQKLVLGMTWEQVIMSWGKPKKINKSVGSWGVNEQWVYDRKYAYIENGKLASFQE